MAYRIAQKSFGNRAGYVNITRRGEVYRDPKGEGRPIDTLADAESALERIKATRGHWRGQTLQIVEI